MIRRNLGVDSLGTSLTSEEVGTKRILSWTTQQTLMYCTDNIGGNIQAEASTDLELPDEILKLALKLGIKEWILRVVAILPIIGVSMFFSIHSISANQR